MKLANEVGSFIDWICIKSFHGLGVPNPDSISRFTRVVKGWFDNSGVSVEIVP